MKKDYKQKQGDVLEDIKTYKDNEFDTIFCDPPYQLGTKWEIGSDGSPKVKGKNSDFMDKWEGLDETTLDNFFKEAFRTTKDGGFVCMFGLYRQSMALQYYAMKNGFEITEPLHMYYISNFPKATDLGKNIDKRLGKERELIPNPLANKQTSQTNTNSLNDKKSVDFISPKPSSKEAQTVDGLKYSVAPLKQVLETLYIFKKPNRTSVVDDTLDRINGDEDVSISALNIDAGRVPTDDSLNDGAYCDSKDGIRDNVYESGHKVLNTDDFVQPKGRFPANLIVDEECAKILDEQSGILTSGGSSKILHKFNNGYENMEYDLLNYGTKVSGKERNAGLDSFEDKKDIRINAPRKDESSKFSEKKNTHPTLKSIQQIEKLFTHFILPKEINQKIYVPFSGTCSEVIGIMKAIEKVHNCSAEEALSHITACEMSEEYIEIGKARVEFWKTHSYNDKKEIVKDLDKETQETQEIQEDEW